MTKPDDIPDDVWQIAWGVVSEIQMKDIKGALPQSWNVFASIERTARAIMAFKPR